MAEAAYPLLPGDVLTQKCTESICITKTINVVFLFIDGKVFQEIMKTTFLKSL